MPRTVSLMLTLEADGTEDGGVCEYLKRVATQLTSSGVEATFVLDSALITQIRTAHADLVRLLQQQNVAYLAQSVACSPMVDCSGCAWDEGVAHFLRGHTEGYNAACWMGAALPVAAVMRGWIGPPFAVMAEWGIRAILGPASPVASYDRPFFYCGRLHFCGLGPNSIRMTPADLADPTSLVARIADRAERIATPGGVIVLRMRADSLVRGARDVNQAVSQFGGLLDRLRPLPTVSIGSVRQVVDRFADISYEHSVPMDIFRNVSCWVWSGEMRPFYYEQGYLSPSEQLYGLVRIWHESIQKGKAVRNTTVKTPLGPAVREATDATVEGIVRDEVPELLAGLLQHMEDKGQLPSSVATRAGRISIYDLLPTLADGVNPKMEPADMELRRGFLDESRVTRARVRECHEDAGLSAESDPSELLEQARLQLWTYKPVLDLIG